MFSDPKSLGLALLGGVIPALIWLWFWLREDQKKDEPNAVLFLCFIMGIISIFFVLPVQKFIKEVVSSNELQIILWAGTEEIFKYLAMIVILYKTKYVDEPIDWAIYMITAALGFAAFENALFLLKPIILDQTTVGFITGHLRFLGATLLHTVTSGIIGIAMGLSYYLDDFRKKTYVIMGIIIATTLHSLFNFFIMKNNGSDFFKVFGFLWVVTIIIMLLFEKLRRMSGQN